MNPIQPILKVFCRDAAPSPGELIAIFHTWIQDRRFGDQLLLFDVADYSHVQQGPGVLLVAQECFLSLGEQEGGGLGLLYRQRRGPALAATEGLRAGLRNLLQAAVMLERDFSDRLRFGPGELLVGFDDQLNAPNTTATSIAFEPAIRAFAAPLYPEGLDIASAAPSRGSFRAKLEATIAPPSLAALQQRLADS